MTNGRAKGSVAEREVAALLAAWWRGIEPTAEFVRTPLSGGWSSPTVRGGFRASGDIMTTSPSFPFVVEVKRREAFAWGTFLKGRKSPVWEWWEQACRAADEQGGTPMLWLRHNGESWRIVLPGDASPAFRLDAIVPRRFLYGKIPSRGLRPDVMVFAANAVLAVSPALFLSPDGDR